MKKEWNNGILCQRHSFGGKMGVESSKIFIKVLIDSLKESYGQPI